MNATFRAGAASRRIVPGPEMIDNSVHSNMTVRFDEQGSPLWVKALYLEFNGRGRILLSVDSVGATRAQCAVLREAVAHATRTTVDDVVITCSHSHSTPFLEPLNGPHPYIDFVKAQSVEAAIEAQQTRQPAAMGTATVNVTDASFNTRVPLAGGGVKFARDFREGLASGRPVDPRLSIVRIDDETGRPIAGWVRFAAHPACVIFNAPISAEYPGYLTDQLSRSAAGGAPVLFAYGASGDVNCIPMFGTESDSAELGGRLADRVAPAFETIQTRAPQRFLSGCRDIQLPLEPVPSLETLDREIEAVRAFAAALDHDPDLEWVLGVNCRKEWSVQSKKSHAAPLAEWAVRVKQAIASGRSFPPTWPVPATSWVIDDLGFVFYGGEPLVELGLELHARSPLAETFVIAMSNGCDAYLGTDDDRKRGGYELYTSPRYAKLAEDSRPLPYAMGAAKCFLDQCLMLINDLQESTTFSLCSDSSAGATAKSRF